ncbi:MAG: hypothetical protein IJZ02_03505 [Clostridia bacterium]|nr:hypothetical protein [Clostridia bacterium]
MKKIYMIIAVLVCVFSFVGCQQELHNQDHFINDTFILAIVEEVEELPYNADIAFIEISAVGKNPTFYIFSEGMTYYVYDHINEQYYEGVLLLPDEYSAGTIVSAAAGGGSGEMNLYVLAHGDDVPSSLCYFFNREISRSEPVSVTVVDSFPEWEDFDTEPIHIPITDQTTSQQQTEYLWTNGARYIIDTDNGYELYDGYTDDLIGTYSDFRILNRFNRQGEIEEVCYIVGEDNGKKCLLEISDNTLIFQKEIKEAIAFYGDYIVIDGRLYNSDIRVFGYVIGEPLEKTPTLTDTITFDESSVRIVYIEDDANKWIKDTAIVDRINGSSISTVRHGNGYYICLNRDSFGFYACSYNADLGGYTQNGFYVRELKEAVDLWYSNELYNVYWAGGVSWVTTPTNEVLCGLDGTINPIGDFLVYCPSDLQLPKTFLTHTGEIFLDKVVAWNESDSGLFIWYFDNYEELADSDGREAGYSADSMLCFIDNNHNLVKYGKYDKIFDVNSIGALVIKENSLTLISADGEIIHKFDGFNNNMRYVETRISDDKKTAEVVFNEYNEAERTTRNVTFHYVIPTSDGENN